MKSERFKTKREARYRYSVLRRNLRVGWIKLYKGHREYVVQYEEVSQSSINLNEEKV